MIQLSVLLLNFISIDICRGLPGTARTTGVMRTITSYTRRVQMSKEQKAIYGKI